MSIFIGGVSLVVQLLVDFDRRLTIADRHQEDRFRKISQATELFGQVEASQLRPDLVVDLVQYAAKIDTAGRPLLAELVRSQLEFTASFLKQLAQGLAVEYPGDEKDWLFALVENSATSIKATSTIGPTGHGLVDEDFWDGPVAGAYLHRQRDAIIRRSVSVRRIFILYQEEMLNSPELRSAVERNFEAGVEVRILHKPPTAYATPLDFILFDDQISYEFSTRQLPGQAISVVQSTELVIRSNLVEQRKNQFNDWWMSAVVPDAVGK
jgi:hypothetical protein